MTQRSHRRQSAPFGPAIAAHDGPAGGHAEGCSAYAGCARAVWSLATRGGMLPRQDLTDA